MMDEGWVDPNHFYGTINCNGVNANGEVCGGTFVQAFVQTFQIPGRAGPFPKTLAPE